MATKAAQIPPNVNLERRWSGVRGVDAVRARRMVINEVGLDALRNYKYKGGPWTPLDKIMDRWVWVPFIEYVPLWVAPNLITAIGLLFVVLSYFLVVYFEPDQTPGWAFVVATFGHFLYQMLDAVDGKQARRTGASSPLGQLFDHGCDSMSTTFVGLTLAHAAGFGATWERLLTLWAIQVPFFLAQWQEYHTHVLMTAAGPVGVTECQFAAMFGLLLRAVLGPACTQATIGGVRIVSCIPPLLVVSSLPVCISNFKAVFNEGGNKKEAVTQLVPLVLLVACGALWATDQASDNIYKSHPRLTGLTLGLVFTYLTNQMILASLCRMKYNTFQPILVPLPIIFINDYFAIHPRHDDVALGIYLGIVVVQTFNFLSSVVEEITHLLGIHCFSLRKREHPPTPSTPAAKQEKPSKETKTK